MSEKTYVFPEGNGSSLDPNLVAMMNGGGGFGGNGFNNPFWALVLLAFLRNNFGWGGDGNGIDILPRLNGVGFLCTSEDC